MKARLWFSLRASAVLGVAFGWFLAGPAGADTVHLKDGGLILECRILREDTEKVYLRTPGGSMGVPKAVIGSIEKAKSLFDTYDEKLARVPKDDFKGFFALAQWCRQAAGLRQEMYGLLEKVVELKKDHTEARRMLGHARIDGQWQ